MSSRHLPHPLGFQAEDHKWHLRAILELQLDLDKEKIMGIGDRPGFSPGVKLSHVNLGKSFNFSEFQFFTFVLTYNMAVRI